MTLEYSILTNFLKRRLWTEDSMMVTLIENIIIKEEVEVSSYEIFNNIKNNVVNNIHTFGEMGVVKVHYDQHQSKMKDKVKTMVFVVYEQSHETNVYRMYDIDTGVIFTSRDIK